MGHHAPTTTVAQLVRAVLAGAAGALAESVPFVCLGDDDEAVHRARVATRRLRSDLETLGPLLDGGWVKATTNELRWLADLLGEVRDRDVLAQRLRRAIAERHAPDTPGAEQLMAILHAERDVARRFLLHALDSGRYALLLDRLAAAAADPPLSPEVSPDDDVRRVLHHLVTRAWRRLAKAVEGLAVDPADPALHRVRRRAKQARYAVELAAQVVGKAATRHAAVIGGLQDVLGDLQDATTADQWLRGTVAEHPSTELAFLAGELCECQRNASIAARRHWRRQWKLANSHHMRAWF